jgi:hypothetical protein
MPPPGFMFLVAGAQSSLVQLRFVGMFGEVRLFEETHMRAEVEEEKVRDTK